MSGNKTISNTTPAIGAIKIQQSTYGVVIPIVWGRTRVTGNLIWYGDFQAIPHTTTTQTGGKGGGGGTSVQNTTFTYAASVGMALCEGPVLGVRTAWRGKNIFNGSTYSGSTALNNELVRVPLSGPMTVTVFNTNGWTPISVERRLDSDYDDGFRYQRAGVWRALSLGSDYTASAGTYTFPAGGQVAPGETLRINYTYLSTASGLSCLSQLGLDLMNGTPGQAPWSYLASRHPSEALGYSGVAYVVGVNYSLDTGAAVENHAFEIETSFMHSALVPDADPSLIATDALTNFQYGAQFGLEKIGPMSDYSNACLAQGIVMSPALTEQMSAASFLDGLATLTNVGLVWSGGMLKFVPYTDTPVTGNGVTFTPNTAPIYDLTDDDFLPGDDEGPIKVTRGAVSDSYNSVKLEYFDRANDYNIAIMEQADQADIQENGPRPMSVVTAHWITETNVAKLVATLILQRSLFIRNTYEFKLGWTKIALEPMDLVTLTDPALGMTKQPVRILRIEESDDGHLSVVAEDFPKGSASATLYPTGSNGGYAPNFNEAPGDVSAPLIFEGPAALAENNSGLEVWLAAGSLSPTYGGCEVWVSLTGSNYERAATLNGISRFGTTTSALPAANTGDLTTDSVGVTLSAGGQLLSASPTERDALMTLCYADQEYFAYETSQLTGASAYTLGTHLVRGAYLSNANQHASGVPFARCDDAIAKVPLTADYIGKTLHIKLLPFNRFGGAAGGLADAVEYTYLITGWQANLPPIAPRNLGTEGPFTISTARFKWDRIGNAASYNVQMWAGTPLRKVREVNVGNSLRYDYSAADAKTDGGPWRTLTIMVQGIHANGAKGAFSSFTATNPQVGALTGAAVASSAGTVQFACDRPDDADFSGIQVWISPTAGFTPGAATLVYDGPSNNVTINRLKDGTQLVLGSTYYLRAAAYDTFDLVGMTYTAELPVAISNTTGVQSAIIQLYQWSTGAPAAPTGSSTYTWATGVNSGYAAAPADGWLVAAGANPGTPLAKLYVATVALTAPVGTTTSTVSYLNANVAAWSQNGSNGTSGLHAGGAIVYQWAVTIPAGPVGSATYTWADGTFGAAPASWTLTSGTAPSAGMTLWAAKVSLVDTATNATTAFNWSAAGISAVGYAGISGSSYVTAYCASSTASTTTAPAQTTGKTSVPAVNAGGLVGTWTAAVPALTSGQMMYQSDGIYDPATNKVTWSIPYWSTLKVASLSAITANLGSITAGDLNLGGGAAHIDNTGAATFTNVTIKTPGGVVLLDTTGAGALQTSINSAASTATWTSITGAGKPADNASSDLVLIGRNATVTGNTAVKTGGSASGWDADVYSADSFTGGAFASAVTVNTGSYFMLALNSDPKTDSSFTSLDYAILLTNDGNTYIYESNSQIGATYGPYAAGDIFAIVYDGSSVKYLKNGAVFYTSLSAASKAPGQTLFFDSALYTMGSTMKNIRFGPMSSNNWANIGGTGKPLDYRVVTQGNSRTATLPAALGFYVGGVLASNVTLGRSYTLVVISRASGAILSSVNYDVYGNGAAPNLANAMNALGPDTIAVVISYDEPMTNRLTGGLLAAMLRCGASTAVFGSPNFKVRSAYVLVGIPGCGEGNGAEAYQGSIGDDPNAWVDIGFSITNGALTGVTSNYVPKSLTDYGYVGDLNATAGATLGVNVGGQINATNAATLVSIPNLSTLTAVIGTLRTATSGGRMELSSNVQTVYDTANGLRVKIGNLS